MSKFINEKTKWKETLLLESKAEAAESLRLFAQEVVAPQRYRIQRCRADRGSEYTGGEFRSYCLQASIKLELGATNTPE